MQHLTLSARYGFQIADDGTYDYIPCAYDCKSNVKHLHGHSQMCCNVGAMLPQAAQVRHKYYAECLIPPVALFNYLYAAIVLVGINQGDPCYYCQVVPCLLRHVCVVLMPRNIHLCLLGCFGS